MADVPRRPLRSPGPLFEHSGMPLAWAGREAWRILQTGAPDTLNFLLAWAAWKKDLDRPRMLHYVVIAPATAEAVQDLHDNEHLPVFAELVPLAQILSSQLVGLLPGFYRLSLEGGQVLLTLCMGQLKPMLKEQNFAADSLLLMGPLAAGITSGELGAANDASLDWDRWTVKSLARCCRSGTGVATDGLTPQALHDLRQGGFDLAQSPLATPLRSSTGVWTGRYLPRWEPRMTRRTFSGGAAKPGTCVVVGAGLAGASVAVSLARRGWQVQVLDAAATCAGGASGLPVGLMVPHVSADDSPRSRLSRSGLRMTRQEALRVLVQDQDWAASGVLELRPGGSLWHASGAWVKPARLVQAWLSQPGVSFVGNASVTSIEPADGQWVLRGAASEILAQASHVVLATAMSTVPLLTRLAESQPGLVNGVHKLPALHGVAGQISWALQSDSDTEALPTFPVNGAGSLISSVPVDGGLGWFVGATYEATPANTPAAIAMHHHANLDRLATLLPGVARALNHHFETGAVQAWRNTRCASTNRLPVVGPLVTGPSPTVWVCTALGSRGLSLSVLCAELLAARLCAEPWPVEASLATSLDSQRSKLAKRIQDVLT